ncbi:hypothetical protein, partial [uncultured Lamprocystis sp.]
HSPLQPNRLSAHAQSGCLFTEIALGATKVAPTRWYIVSRKSPNVSGYQVAMPERHVSADCCPSMRQARRASLRKKPMDEINKIAQKA